MQFLEHGVYDALKRGFVKKIIFGLGPPTSLADDEIPILQLSFCYF